MSPNRLRFVAASFMLMSIIADAEELAKETLHQRLMGTWTVDWKPTIKNFKNGSSWLAKIAGATSEKHMQAIRAIGHPYLKFDKQTMTGHMVGVAADLHYAVTSEKGEEIVLTMKQDGKKEEIKIEIKFLDRDRFSFSPLEKAGEPYWFEALAWRRGKPPATEAEKRAHESLVLKAVIAEHPKDKAAAGLLPIHDSLQTVVQEGNIRAVKVLLDDGAADRIDAKAWTNMLRMERALMPILLEDARTTTKKLLHVRTEKEYQDILQKVRLKEKAVRDHQRILQLLDKYDTERKDKR